MDPSSVGRSRPIESSLLVGVAACFLRAGGIMVSHETLRR
jgi:hypothetical protein